MTTTAGLRLSVQRTPQPPAVTLDDDAAPAAVWAELAEELEPAIRGAVRELLADDGPTHHAHRADVLRAAGVTASWVAPEYTDATAHAMAETLAGFDQGPETDAHEAASDLLRAFGQGETCPTLGTHAPLSAVRAGPLALLAAASPTPTVTIRLRDSWFGRRADHRRETCRLLAAVTDVAAVRIVATGLQQRRLAREHRAELPGAVNEQCSTHHDPGPLKERVAAARAAFDADGREVALLRRLADEPTETLAYAELRAAYEVSRSRISQVLSRLADHDLVARFGPHGSRKIELLEAGRELVSAIDADAGRQKALSAVGADADSGALADPDRTTHRQCNPDKDGEGGMGEPSQETVPYRVRWMGRAGHAAAVAVAPPSQEGLTLAETAAGEQALRERRTHRISYDRNRQEAAVSIHATGALQYTVSHAVALASPRLLGELEPSLRAIEDDTAVLRDVRCIGWLSDEAVADTDELIEALTGAREELLELTRALRAGDYEDRAQCRRDCLRQAHGLGTAVVHLLAAAGIDVVRECRVPAGLDDDHLSELADAVAEQAVRQSRYEGHALYRQLYEDRERKRERATRPTVNASDPHGALIGSLAIRGPDVNRLEAPLRAALSNPTTCELHEDAPEVAVAVPIERVGRQAWATVAGRVLSRKGLRPTRRAVSVLHAVTASPWAAAEGLEQLAGENGGREIRADELRHALATLPAERLLPEGSPTVRAMLGALFRAERPVSPGELADRADVSRRSVRRRRETLTALGLVEETEAGWRATLSFPTQAERRGGDEIWPVFTRESARFTEALGELLAARLSAARYADPTDPVAGRLFWPPEPWALAAHPEHGPWIRVAAALTGTPPPDGEGDASVRFGAEIEQAALTEENPDAVRAR
jgi:DNA-binding transcriptional ArsR family regulator